ncbi:hypothetical protein PTTG_26930 [Puccinia triticina 1-1 BBBD Race 1]|uniref:Uncharacterized protein n=2 Tax=Puccinia triticina TaxID=208348 RepID=A0A180GQ73_PUCT1|nr:uncharacterized protein PtA15_5A127 [Puccinia triticina]OAV94578.1 hypothetical protein PTTG_26930 [Puccinia triticina 1-1 BBBD Race 1]WAQ84557.1 hypothetical protein PtA15_5A127 [Puccinia triticina]WAR57902.1 hypothetical protein PtB15_5B132 [Puccinia triticina]
MSSSSDNQQAINWGIPLDSSGQPLDDHNNTSTIITAATTVSLILLGLALIFTVLKVTTWMRTQSEYSRLRAVKARVAYLEHLELSKPNQQLPRTQNSLGTPLPDSIATPVHRNLQVANQETKKLRNLFDIEEYEGTPA